jgi:hypothetical protein
MRAAIHATDGREVWLYVHPVDHGGVTIALGDPNRGFNNPATVSPADAVQLAHWLLELAQPREGNP